MVALRWEASRGWCDAGIRSAAEALASLDKSSAVAGRLPVAVRHPPETERRREAPSHSMQVDRCRLQALPIRCAPVEAQGRGLELATVGLASRPQGGACG